MLRLHTASLRHVHGYISHIVPLFLIKTIKCNCIYKGVFKKYVLTYLEGQYLLEEVNDDVGWKKHRRGKTCQKHN